MRPICREAGDLTYFLITDVEPAFEEAVQAMMYPWQGDGYGRAFPSDTPGLDRIYANFERAS